MAPFLSEPGATTVLTTPARPSAPAIPVIALATTMVIGGSGSMNPLPEIVNECLLAALTLAWVWGHPGDWRRVPRSAWIIVTVLLAVPLGQLLPLPPGLWQSLPGRSAERAALALIGSGASGDSHWQPLSLTPNRTLAALLAMAAAAAMLVMAAAQDRRGRAALLATMAAVALLSVLVGAAQLSGGAGNPFRFYNPAEIFLDGFQTNHNAQADVLLIGMVALATVGAEYARRPSRLAQRRERPVPPQLWAAIGGATLLLMLGVVMTASRTGIALLIVASAAQAAILWRWRPATWRIAAAAVAGLAAMGVVAALSGPHGALGRVWDRFYTPAEFRPEIWRDAVFALRQVWPWGAGMGSFVPVFAAAERLDVVTGKFVNRAHDDYLELLIEAGLPGVIALAVICWQVAGNAARGWRRRTAGARPQLLAGGASLLIVALHALGDYPLRTLSEACMVATCAALLLPIAEPAGPGKGRDGM